MARAMRTTYGFGRISASATPSPYSPLHRPSQMPGSFPMLASRPTRRRRWLGVVGFVGIAAAAVLALALNQTRSTAVVAAQAPAKAPVKPSAGPPVPALGADETTRLPRSAIAVQPQAPRSRI